MGGVSISRVRPEAQPETTVAMAREIRIGFTLMVLDFPLSCGWLTVSTGWLAKKGEVGPVCVLLWTTLQLAAPAIARMVTMRTAHPVPAIHMQVPREATFIFVKTNNRLT
jgi:hypothetical protein